MTDAARSPTHPATQLLISADLHLDVITHSRLNPVTGRHTAWDSTNACWTHIADVAIDRSVDAFIFAGDAFRTHAPGPEALALFAEQIRRIAAQHIPVVLIVGNHEVETLPPRHRHILHQFADIAGVTVIDQPDIVTLADGTQIVALPWRRRHDVLTADQRAGLNPADTDALVAAATIEDLDRLAERCDTRRGPVVLTGHATLGDAVIGSSRRGTEILIHPVFAEPTVQLDALDHHPWPVAVFGHIHKRQTLPTTTGVEVLYSGSPNRIDFAEARDPKGATLVRFDTAGNAAVELVETPARTFATVTPDDLTSGDIDLTDAIVRIDLPEGWDGNDTTLRAAARSAGADTVILNPAHATRRSRTAPTGIPVGEDIDIVDGLSLWADANNLSSAQREKLLDAARTLTEQAAPTAPTAGH